MSRERKFIDGIESMSFTEGVIHVQLFNYIAGSQKSKEQSPQMEVTEELIFTPQGFLRAFSAMQKLVGHLEKAGVIKNNEDSAAKPVEAEIVDEAPASVSSPNWKTN